jgi:hypothetical protein
LIVIFEGVEIRRPLADWTTGRRFHGGEEPVVDRAA